MKTPFRTLPVSIMLLTTAGSNAALLLSVDFGSSETLRVAPGFEAQSSGSKVHSTINGDMTVTSDGLFFNRGATGANQDLYSDFTYLNNSTPLTLTISGPGIAANTDYVLKVWSYDSNNGSKEHSQTADGVSGTVGSTAPIVYPGTEDLDSIDSYSSEATFTSDGSGTLTIALTDTITAGNVAQPEPRLNAFQLSTAIPEPSTSALFGLGFLGMMIRRRRS